MIVPKGTFMATSKKMILQTSLELTQEQFSNLAGMVPGEAPDDRKVQSVILKAAIDLATGGLLLTPEEVERMSEATGVDPSCGEDLIPFLSAATGMEEGKHSFKVAIDPIYFEQLKEIAEFRGWPVEQVIQETVDACFENNWFETIPEQPRHVRMSEEEAKGLEDIFGEKFENGTELAALVRQQLGEGLFSEPAEAAPAEESNVGQGAEA